MSTTHKYFWLKLKRDFFKRHDIRIIEAMPNGKDYVLFYLKLLTESIDHEGRLRFSDTIPYNLEMLSTITDTNIDIVRTAVKLFVELEMMEQLDDGTLYMSQVVTMIGSETSEAMRKRKARERPTQFLVEQEKGGHCPDLSAPCPPLSGKCPPELELDIEKEKDIEHTTRAPVFSHEPVQEAPSLSEYQAIIREEWDKLGGKVYPAPDPIRFASVSWRDIAPCIKGIHSDKVLQAIRNLGIILGDTKGKYWWTQPCGIVPFFQKHLERFLPGNFREEHFYSKDFLDNYNPALEKKLAEMKARDEANAAQRNA